MNPMPRQARATRAARGAVAASVATFVALLSHVSGGGDLPGVFGLAVPLALSFVVCTALAGRRLSTWRLAVAVALSQVLFHTLFVLGSYDLAAGMHMHGSALPALSSGAGLPAHTPDAAMWLGHAVAAVATTIALHRGERTLAGLRVLAERSVAWLRARIRVVLALPAAPAVRRTMAAAVVAVRPNAVLVVSSARRRGPPLAAS